MAVPRGDRITFGAVLFRAIFDGDFIGHRSIIRGITLEIGGASMVWLVDSANLISQPVGSAAYLDSENAAVLHFQQIVLTPVAHCYLRPFRS